MVVGSTRARQQNAAWRPLGGAHSFSRGVQFALCEASKYLFYLRHLGRYIGVAFVPDRVFQFAVLSFGGVANWNGPGRERTLHRCTLLRYESGPLYKPSRRDVPLVLKDVDAAEAVRMRSIWTYWEQGAVTFEMAAGGGEGAEASEGEAESDARGT